jgi:hypothetical protein
VQRLGNLERVDRAGRPVLVAVALEEPAVEQHANGLDGVERDAFCAVADHAAELAGQTRNEPLEELVHRGRRERFEEQRREVTLPGAPGRVLVGDLGPRERDDEQRMRARPFEQVLDELGQRRVGPLEILEDEHGRRDGREPLEEEPPGGEEVLAIRGRPLGEPEQVREPRLEPASLLRVVDVLADRSQKLLQRRVRGLAFGDARAHPNHLRECPVRNALAVREATAAVPPHVADETVEVLLELPRQP